MNPSSAMALVSTGVMSAARTADVSAAPNARLRRHNIAFAFMFVCFLKLLGSLHSARFSGGAVQLPRPLRLSASRSAGDPKTKVFDPSFNGRENMLYSWQNVLRKPSQNVRFINASYFLDLRHAHWLRPRLDR